MKINSIKEFDTPAIASFAQKVKKIRMIVLDVDGTMTDGSIYIGANGEVMKSFDGKDGMGIALWHHAGFLTAIITGRKSEIVNRRAEELHIASVTQGAVDKHAAYDALKEKYGLADDEIAYIGDDLNDLPIMTQVGLSIGVGDACAEVKERVDMVTERAGGHGAIREAIEYMLKAKDLWDGLMRELFF